MFNIYKQKVTYNYNSTNVSGPIQQMALLGKDETTDSKIVPAGAKRVAVMILSFNDCIFDVSGKSASRLKQSGIVNLQKRILESLGYTVMQIRYDELKPRSQLNNVKYLKSKLQDLLK